MTATGASHISTDGSLYLLFMREEDRPWEQERRNTTLLFLGKEKSQLKKALKWRPVQLQRCLGCSLVKWFMSKEGVRNRLIIPYVYTHLSVYKSC